MNAEGEWSLAPAYDLTFSSGPNGEQSTTVMGEGRNPSVEHLLKLANNSDIKKQKAEEILAEIESSLGNWTTLAKKYGVGSSNIKFIQSKLKC